MSIADLIDHIENERAEADYWREQGEAGTITINIEQADALHKAMFIKANDMFPEVDYRTRMLKQLRARIIAKIDDLMPQGGYA